MTDKALDRAVRAICPSRDLCDADACCASCRLADSEITDGPLASDIARAAIAAFQAGALVVEIGPPTNDGECGRCDLMTSDFHARCNLRLATYATPDEEGLNPRPGPNCPGPAPEGYEYRLTLMPVREEPTDA